LQHGDRRTHFAARGASSSTRSRTASACTIAARTIEDWYYAYLEGGWKALMPAARDDRGISRAIRPEIAAKLIAAKRQKPRRSIGLLIKCFVRLRWVKKDELKRSTVHRLLQANALSLRPPRAHGHRRSFLPDERRSFLPSTPATCGSAT
jgi:hypothetical protein